MEGLHDRSASAAGSGIHRGRKQRKRVVEMNDLRAVFANAIGDVGCRRAVPNGGSRQFQAAV